MKTEPEAASAICERLGGELRATLAEVLEGIKQVALVDFPEHDNVGDSAIWQGERRLLAELDIDVVYCSTRNSYNAGALRQRLHRSGTILLKGGGDFGDLWPNFQAFRERVLQDFPRRRIVQMPQTIHFSGRKTLSAAREVFGHHPNITVLVRDEQSLNVAHTLVGSRTRLCPDGAFSLRLRQPKSPEQDVLWLMRRDKEAAMDTDGTSCMTGVTTLVSDWPEDPFRKPEGPRIVRSIDYRLRRYNRMISQNPSVGHLSRLNRPSSLDHRAERRLAGGIDLLSRGRVVVTDRLHGHILCLLLNKPHVVVDNSYGKLGRFMATWRTASDSVRVATGLDQAAKAAVELMNATR